MHPLIFKPKLPVRSTKVLSPPASWLDEPASPGICIPEAELTAHLATLGTTGSGKTLGLPSLRRTLVVGGSDQSILPWYELTEHDWVLWVNTYLPLNSASIDAFTLVDCDSHGAEVTIESKLSRAALLAACQEGFPELTFRILEH